MDFLITGLPGAAFRPLFDLTQTELAQRGAVRKIADRCPGYPCRVSLCDAQLGEDVLLLNYEHLAVPGPYRSRHAIFVRQAATDARLAINEIPQSLQIRLLSLRAFDAAGMMVEADVLPGGDLGGAIRRMLDNRSVDFLHVHNAKHGCYAARVDRAP